MQCNCREEYEAKIAEVVQKDLPEGWKDFDADLKGYLFTFGEKLDSRFAVKYQGEVWVPKKGGDGFKKQKVDTFIQAAYCPFCGKAAKESKADAE